MLNWSDRARWRPSLAALVFRLFGGSREFNPIAIAVAPFAWPRRFRFYRAFRAFKRGRPQDVEDVHRRLLAELDRLAPAAKGR